MCIIAIKVKSSAYPSYKRVKTMAENNNDGFAIVWQAKEEPVRNYRTLSESKFLKKYKELTSKYKAKDVSMFIHARIKTHGTQKLDNCHGWINNKVGFAFAHNGVLSIKNRDDMTDSETFFMDIFSPIFEVGGWDAASLAVKACIGTSKFVFMDMYGHITHFGNYITGDDGVLYSNDSYLERPWKNTNYNFGCGNSRTTGKWIHTHQPVYDYDNYDDWYNSTSYWDNKETKDSPSNSAKYQL